MKQSIYASMMQALVGFSVLKDGKPINKWEVWVDLVDMSDNDLVVLSHKVDEFITNTLANYKIVSKFELLDGAKDKARFEGRF